MTHALIIYQDRNKEWRWRLRQIRNRKIVADSGEGYKTKYGCKRAVKRLPFNWEKVQ